MFFLNLFQWPWQTKIKDFAKHLLTNILTDPKIFYAASTFLFSVLFLLVLAYYRIRGLAKGYANIVRIKRNLEAIAKDRLKRTSYSLRNFTIEIAYITTDTRYLMFP